MCNVLTQTSLMTALLLLSLNVFSGHPGEAANMQHPPIMMPEGLPEPGLSLALSPDAMSGFNLTLRTTNYKLIPPHLASNKPPLKLEGHAHLYINGVKAQRLYGSYTHIPSTLLIDGINQITVSLNNHYHQTWQLAKGVKKGETLTATLIIDTRLPDFIKNHFSISPII